MLKYMLYGAVVMAPVSVYGSDQPNINPMPTDTAGHWTETYSIYKETPTNSTTSSTSATTDSWAVAVAALSAGYGPLPHCGRTGSYTFMPLQDRPWKQVSNSIKSETTSTSKQNKGI